MRQSFTYSNGISITYTLFDETNFHAHNPNSKLRLVSARTPVTTIQFAARQSGLEIRSRDSDFERQDDLYYACTRKVHDDDADGSWLGAKERSRRAQPLHPLPLRPYSTSILYQPSVRSLLFRFFFFFFFFFGVDIEKLQELVLAELAFSFSLLFFLAIFTDFLLLIVSF